MTICEGQQDDLQGDAPHTHGVLLCQLQINQPNKL
jgi:hypothetical protein